VGSEAETVSRLSANPKLAAERQAKLDALGEQPGWWRPFARRRWRDRRAAILAVDISEAAAMLRAIYDSAWSEEVALRPSPAFASLLKETCTMPYEVVRLDWAPHIEGCTFTRCDFTARPIIDRDPGDES
jgi:23S rRNA U2552 (ribose-2'-O)-methylase RlmE/FtsJ